MAERGGSILCSYISLLRYCASYIRDLHALCHDKGLLNEFAMMYALRERFPLHYVVFRQTSSHLPHEANVEQVFSRSGLVGPEHAA